MPTLLAARGDNTIKEDLLKSRKIGDTTYKVHLDGYNLLPALKGEGPCRTRVHLLHGDGSVAALRYGNWKATFLRQGRSRLTRLAGAVTQLRAPMLTNLRHGPIRTSPRDRHGYQRGWPSICS